MVKLYEGFLAFLKINFSYFLLFFIISILCKIIFPYFFKSSWQTKKRMGDVYESTLSYYEEHSWQKLKNTKLLLKFVIIIIALAFFFYLLSIIKITTINTFSRIYFFLFFISLLSVRAFIKILQETETRNAV